MAGIFGRRRSAAPRATNYARGWHVCTGCGQRIQYSDRAPGRLGVLCCPRCLCAPGEAQPPTAPGAAPVIVHLYQMRYGSTRPAEAFAREAAALARAGWRVMQQSQSGQYYVMGAGWQPATITVTYERAPSA